MSEEIIKKHFLVLSSIFIIKIFQSLLIYCLIPKKFKGHCLRNNNFECRKQKQNRRHKLIKIKDKPLLNINYITSKFIKLLYKNSNL